MAPGLQKLVEGNQAGICSRQDPTELADVLSRLLGADDLRRALGERGRTLVIQNYSVNSVVGQLAGLYESLTPVKH